MQLALRPGFFYFLVFCIPFILAQLPFMNGIIDLSDETKYIIYKSILAFYVGLFFSKIIFSFIYKHYSIVKGSICLSINHTRVQYFLLFFGVLCVSSYLIEIINLGGIPMFMNDFENARLNLQVNGYIHLLAINTGFVGFLYFSVWGLEKNTGQDERLLSSYKKKGLFFLFLVLLLGNRSDLMIPIVAIIAFLVFNRFIKITKRLYIICFLLLISIGLIKHYREVGAAGSDYVYMVYDQLGSESSLMLLLYPLYMTFTYNFEILDRFVTSLGEYRTGGMYTFYSVYSLLPGEQESFGAFKNKVMGVDFYSGLTSTYISNFYSDWGEIGVVLVSFLMALFFGMSYYFARVSLMLSFVYAVIISRMCLLFYVHPFEQFNSVFQVIMVVFFVFYVFKRESSWRKV